MNKRILSILLCLMLVVSLLVMAVPVSAAPSDVTITLTADKTNANPGDDVTFTVTLGPIAALGSFDARVALPAGLTYKSSETASGLISTMGLAMGGIEGLSINGFVAEQNYSSESDTVLGTITCTVDDDASGTLEVGFEEDAFDFGLLYDWDVVLGYNAVPASVTVGGGNVTEAPATEAPVTEAPATEAPATEAPATEAPVTEAPATEAHVHNLTYVPQVDATPESDGVKEHFVCTTCGKKYADESGLIEVTDEELRIAYVAPTEAPATEAPATEAPATEAPATEAPATEAPATEAPATEAPATEAPATEAPVTEAPATEAPIVTEAPATEAPVVTEAPATPDQPTVAPTNAATKDSSTKDSSTKDSSTSPKTGDSTHMYLWMLIMLASLVGVAAVLYTAKRKGIFTK